MGQAIGDFLPLALGVALSPVPIIAVILMLFSPRASSNAPAFLAGWLLGLAVLGAIILLAASGADASDDEGASDVIDMIKIALGALLLLVALRQWQGRPKAGEQAAMPGWMSAIDSFTAVKALGIGVLLAAVNPKNLALTAAAAAGIAQAGLDDREEWLSLLIFVLIGSLTVGVPVIYYFVAGEGARATLDTWRAWLGENNAAVMAVLLLVFGVVILGQGLSGLSD
ncbi:MAG TPA: GAP family protein [Dehalococcoidia bacterium]|nr:GAP family protein [Dehalococcoidia bacterium]